VELIISLRLEKTQAEIGRMLGRSRSAVSQKLTKLGLVGDRTQDDWARRGEASPSWKGGSYSYYFNAFYSRQWRQKIRPQVLERDGYECVVCGRSQRLQVHHIDPFRETRDHSIENQVTLCIRHHKWAEVSLDRKIMKQAMKSRDFSEVQELAPKRLTLRELERVEDLRD